MTASGRPSARPAPRSAARDAALAEARLWRILTLAPALAVLLLLTAAPLVALVTMVFYDIRWVQGVAQWTFVGARHLLALPTDTLFRAGIGNTAVFAAAAVSLEMLLGFLLAWATSQVIRGRVFYRTIFLLPILVPGIVIGAIWQLMYNVDFGIINALVESVGLPPQEWLGTRRLALLSVIIVDVWHWTPFCFLLLLAGLETLPVEIHEAAVVDGAGAFAELRLITLPLMLPTILVTLIFRLIVALKVFDEVYLLTGGGPGTSTEVISFTIYRRFFTENRTGIGSAMSVTTLIAISLVVVLALAWLRRRQART